MSSSSLDFPQIEKALELAVSRGRVVFGTRKVQQGIIKGDIKLVILSNNCPLEQRERVLHLTRLSSIPCITLGNRGSWDLGALCGRPHRVSALGIIDPGDSNILDLIST